MTLEINSIQSIFQIRPQYSYSINPFRQTNVKPVSFGMKLDSLTSELEQYMTRDAIWEMYKRNPKVQKILDEMGIKFHINMLTMEDLKKNHLRSTKEIADKILKNLPGQLQVNPRIILQAAAIHDIGKVLIPRNILNKPDKLIPEEWAIMRRHSELSYELLKTTNLNPKVLELIKYHHLDQGYPKVDDDFMPNLNVKILIGADKYSALRQKRPYKLPFSHEKALGIILEEVDKEKVDPYVYEALKTAYAGEKLTIPQPQWPILNHASANGFSI